MSGIRFLAVIPARHGSKEVPGKNLQILGGKPLVQFTIDAALESSRLDGVLVSSDDPEVLHLGREAGVSMSLERPAHLATDDASQVDVVLHALEAWGEAHPAPQALVLLQPTSPFRTGADIDGALELASEPGVESVVSVCVPSQHPFDCVAVDSRDGSLVTFSPPGLSGRQGFLSYYFLDGGVYVTTVDRFRETRTFVDSATRIYQVPRTHGIDIDHPQDLEVARAVWEYASRTGSPILDL